jgi:DNA-directed RNA polymerase subunit M
MEYITMEFCPQCKSMMMPSGGKMICRKCGFEKEKTKSAHNITKKEFKEREITVIEGDEAAGLPTTRVLCEECGNKTAYWWLRQLRSADESETRFFRCTKCGRTWREYD